MDKGDSFENFVLTLCKSYPFLCWLIDNQKGSFCVYGGFLRWCAERYNDNPHEFPDLQTFTNDIDLSISFNVADAVIGEALRRNAIIEYGCSDYIKRKEPEERSSGDEITAPYPLGSYWIWVDNIKFDVNFYEGRFHMSHCDFMINCVYFSWCEFSFSNFDEPEKQQEGGRWRLSYFYKDIPKYLKHIKARKLALFDKNLKTYYRIVKMSEKGYFVATETLEHIVATLRLSLNPKVPHYGMFDKYKYYISEGDTSRPSLPPSFEVVSFEVADIEEKRNCVRVTAHKTRLLTVEEVFSSLENLLSKIKAPQV